MSDKDVVPFEGPDKYNRRALGSARLVPQENLDRQGYRKGDFWLGRTLRGKPVGWNEELNLLTCSGPGGGKGVSSVIPNLLEFPGSAVVVDPKGELATLTAAFRRDVLGQKVIVLDPARTANVPEELRGTYNPFDELDASDPLVSTAAQVIASAIVMPNPKAKDPFWDDNALDFIQSCILYMVRHYPPAMRTLMKLRETVSLGDKALFDAWVKTKQEEDPDFQGSHSDAFALFQRAMFDTDDFGGVVRETAAKIGRMGENTQGGVLSTSATHLDFVKSPELWSVLGSNPDAAKTFRLRELRRQDRPLTVYLCLPVDMIPRQGRWFRLVISRIIQFIERSAFDKSKDVPILMMIDEFFQLGPIPTITNTLTYSRSFGLRLWLIVQDLNQLKTNYPEAWETILGACGIKQFFGVNDLFTARYVSELIGEEEIDVPSISLTRTSSDTESVNGSETNTQSLTRTTGTNKSKTTGISGSTTHGFTSGISTSLTSGTSRNTSTNSGTSGGTSQGINEGTSSGENEGDSFGRNTGKNYNGNDFLAASRSAGESSGHNVGTNSSRSAGTSSGSNSGWNAGASLSSGTSSGKSTSLSYGSSVSETAGWNKSTTTGKSNSLAKGESTAIGKGWGTSTSLGTNYGLSVSKQKRRRFTPDEVMLSFTKNNLIQLIHIRDQGGLMLFRTPFYADPHFRWLLKTHSEIPLLQNSPASALPFSFEEEGTPAYINRKTSNDE